MLIDDIEAHWVWVRAFGYVAEDTDCDGRRVRYADHGKLTEFGWEKDHHIPNALGGPDTLANKRPRHWLGNRRAGGLLNTPQAQAAAAVRLARALMQPPSPSNALMQQPTGLPGLLSKR